MLNIFMLFYCIALKGKANETQAKPNRDHAKGICEIGGETPVTPGMKVPVTVAATGYVDSEHC